MAKAERRSDVVDAMSIAAVETEVGIGKDSLRVWEKRYGFPAPIRDAHDDRLYPADQVVKLKAIKRLLDCGHAPRRLLALDNTELSALLGPARSTWHDNVEAHGAVEMLRGRKLRKFDSWLRHSLVRDGLERFVLGDGRAVVEAIGNAWQAGVLTIWQEHYFSERFSALLSGVISEMSGDDGRPNMLFATPSGERHGLGLLMAQALFAARGASCLSLGKDIPNAEIVACAADSGINVVVLSISTGYPLPHAADVLAQLRQTLPEKTQLWIGGAAVAGLDRKHKLEGINLLASFEDGLAALEAWHKL